MPHFSFEGLDVWQKSVDFADRIIDVVDAIESDRKHFRLMEQMESSVTSVAMNISEGKGRISRKEFVQFLSFARGSLFEAVTLLEIFRRRRWVADTEHSELCDRADEIGKMISGLINSMRSGVRR